MLKFFKISDLEADYREFGASIVNLGHLETGIITQLEKFGEATNKFADAWKRMV
jgi:hypothetical protein